MKGMSTVIGFMIVLIIIISIIIPLFFSILSYPSQEKVASEELSPYKYMAQLQKDEVATSLYAKNAYLDIEYNDSIVYFIILNNYYTVNITVTNIYANQTLINKELNVSLPSTAS